MTLSSIAMLLFVLLTLVSLTTAEYNVKCMNESVSETVFKPSEDGVKGRFDLEWCTSGKLNATVWEMILSYNLFKNQHNCDSRTLPAQKHSHFKAYFEPEDVNCTNLCFYTTLDMVFTGCYVLENWLPAMGSRRDFYGEYIVNNLTRQSFFENKVTADAFDHEDYLKVHWHLGNIIAKNFDMMLCKNTTWPEHQEENCERITDNCTVPVSRPHDIICITGPRYGKYFMQLRNRGPWIVSSVFKKQVIIQYSFEILNVTYTISRPAPPVAWWCGAALAAGAAAGAALVAARVAAARALRRRVWTQWHENRKQDVELVTQAETFRSVLFLYAREGDAGEPLVMALKELLRSAQLQVYDLYSPEIVSQSAPAPAWWLREQLQRADVAVLLLQTPALAALYSHTVVPPSPGADASLLNRVVPMEPSPGDALLSLALRILAEDVCTVTPYNKYYLAQLECLETETLPYVVPFRRYSIPAHARALCGALAASGAAGGAAGGAGSGASSEDALRAVSRAARGLLRHVRDNPGYLSDHLLIL